MTTDPGRVRADMRAMEAHMQSLVEPVARSLSDTQRLIERSRAQLDAAEAHLNRRLDQIEAAIDECEYRRDEGYRVNCSPLHRQREQTRNAIRTIARQRQTIEAKIERYRNAAITLQEMIDKEIPRAAHWLRDREQKLQKFDGDTLSFGTASAARSRSTAGKSQGGSPSIDSLIELGRAAIAKRDPVLLSAFNSYFSGMGNHGYQYKKTRQEYLRGLVDDPNAARHIRGWIRQEMNRLDAVKRANAAGLQPPGGSQTALRVPPGHDVGHRFAGLDHPANYRLEIPWLNQTRPARARRMGLPAWIR